jgi:hypothetical protein
MNELKEFVTEMVSCVGKKKKDFGFVLLRWSTEEPYWCVFACKLDNFGIAAIGGHCCIKKDAKIQDVLTILAESGWKVEVHTDFFADYD